jgi:hypothetical protein
MKYILFLFVIISITTNCSKDNSENSGNFNNGIVIKGYIPGLNTKSMMLKSANSLTLADSKKVLVFSKYYYKLFDITDSAFSATAQYGTGAALIFLDGNYKYIGHLSPQGLSILPLGNLINGENTTIDLSKLTMVGNSVIPSHDPLGNEIQITPKEINCLKAIDDYYEAIAKNMDADNNGTPDVIEHKQLLIYTMLTVFGGKWGFNQTPATVTDSAHYYVNYMVEFGGGDSLSFNYNDISVTGPTEEPYNDIKLWGYMKAPACGGNRGFISSFCRETQASQNAPWGSAFLPFKEGTYTLTLNGNQSFSLYYSNINMYYNLFIVVPTLHTNDAGKLTSITFEYNLPNGSSINPASLVTNVMVQFCDNQMHQFYVNDRNKLTTQTGFDELVFETPMDIGRLYQMDLWYDDLLGNQYDIIWRQ